MRMRYALVLGLLVATAGSASAQTQIQTQGPENWPGKNDLSVHIGYQWGVAGNNFGNPSGFKLFAEYARSLTDVVWLDFQFNNTFGFAVGGGTCYDRFGNPYACTGGATYYYGGSATELAAGVKLKFKTAIPLVIEVPLVAALEFLWGRECGDNGFAPVAKVGGGAKYFITKNVGLGLGINFALGPDFHGGNANAPGYCGNVVSYTDLYVAVDLQLGAEFVF